jgi:hypothetical protein
VKIARIPCVFGIGWQTVEQVTEPKKAPAKKSVQKDVQKPVQKKATKKTVGRDTKLTPERQETILDALKTGCYIENRVPVCRDFGSHNVQLD